MLPDLVLPGRNGIALMSEVPELSDLPVIFISGYGRNETIARALAARAADDVAKPFPPTELTKAGRAGVAGPHRRGAVRARRARHRLRAPPGDGGQAGGGAAAPVRPCRRPGAHHPPGPAARAAASSGAGPAPGTHAAPGGCTASGAPGLVVSPGHLRQDQLVQGQVRHRPAQPLVLPLQAHQLTELLRPVCAPARCQAGVRQFTATTAIPCHRLRNLPERRVRTCGSPS